jgi:uncharacterized protein DUF1552
MNSRTWKIHRRTALQGLGVTLGLPLLEAMTPVAAAKAPGAKPPVRLLFIFVPGGVNVDAWTPRGEGADYEASATLAALAPVRSDVLVLSGLNGRQGELGGNGHPLGTAPWLSSAPINERDRGGYATGISIDQIAAAKIGQNTRLPSLELGCDRNSTDMHTSNISWRGPSSPMGKETDPRAVYARLFGDPHSGRQNQRLLDLVLEDAQTVRNQLGQLDRQKLDEYLDSVRSIERRIELSQRDNQANRPPQINLPDTIPGQYAEHLRLLLDLLALGLASDSTRVATFMFNNEPGRTAWPEVGVNENHHGLAHLDPRTQEGQFKLAALAKIDRWYVEQYVYLLQKMKATREGEGTLLDNSMIMYGSGLAWGRLHNRENLPILLAGGGGGTIQGGRRVRYGGVPLANLFLSLLDRVGVEVDRVADSTGRLPQLTA